MALLWAGIPKVKPYLWVSFGFFVGFDIAKAGGGETGRAQCEELSLLVCYF